MQARESSMRLGRRFLLVLAGTTVFVAGCGEAPVAPPAQAAQEVWYPINDKHTWEEVCHVDEAGTVTVLRVVEGIPVRAHLAHGDVRREVRPSAQDHYDASAWRAEQPPARAFDRNPWLGWNSGLHTNDENGTQWIEVYFGSPQQFRRIEAHVDQLPETGETTHQVWLDGNLRHEWDGTTTLGQWLAHDFPGPVNAQRVVLRTIKSPSWVAWFEIRLLRC